MNVGLFVASLALTVAIAGTIRWRFTDRTPAWAYRGSVFASAGASSVWLALSGHPAIGSFAALAGSLVGGVAVTTSTMGFVEDNAPVSSGVRERILAYHRLGRLKYPVEPQLKRVLDIAVAVVGVLVAFPLWIVVATCIWMEQPGPVLFTKNSVGKGGIVFRQIKFRTMRYDAERLTGPIAARAGDRRTLRFGACLRRWHLDEMPELINVLAGTMSLVGPRPLRAVLVQRYLEDVPGFVHRHVVRPGIACIAQIEKYHISPHERLRKDRVYIRRMSVGFDIRLLLRAVITTIHGTRDDNDDKDYQHRCA